MSSSEPRNPLYLLLLIVGTIFCLTALAYALVPVLEQKALDAGRSLDPSPFREALRAHGWRWLLYELALLFALGIASMVVDRLRTLRWPPPSAQNDSSVRVLDEGLPEDE